MSRHRNALTAEIELPECSHPEESWEQRFRDGGFCRSCFQFLWGSLSGGRFRLPEDLRRPAEPAPVEISESLFDMEDY